MCDGITFLYNWEAFKAYNAEVEAKIEKLRVFMGADKRNADLKLELQGTTPTSGGCASSGEMHGNLQPVHQDPA